MTRAITTRGAVAIALTAALCSASPPAKGARPLPLRMPSGAARVHVVEARGASLASARTESVRFVTPVEHCLENARREDPVAFARVPIAQVVVHLGRDGSASTVDIDPSSLAHGLSQCVASVLLGWRHGGHTAPRATLRVLVDLNAQPLSQAALAR